MIRPTLPAVLLVCSCSLLGSGCASAPLYDGPAFRSSPDGPSIDRVALVSAAREELGERGFKIDRVDAARGVVTSAYQSVLLDGVGAGSSIGSAAAIVNRHEHAVRIETSEGGGFGVRVLVRRVDQPSWRVETESVALTSRARLIEPDGSASARVVYTSIGQDAALASRIGAGIERRLAARSGTE